MPSRTGFAGWGALDPRTRPEMSRESLLPLSITLDSLAFFAHNHRGTLGRLCRVACALLFSGNDLGGLCDARAF